MSETGQQAKDRLVPEAASSLRSDSGGVLAGDQCGYSEHEGRVRLEMTPADYKILLAICAVSIGAAERAGAHSTAVRFIRLANRLNEGNPQYKPYVVPEEAAGVVEDAHA